MASGTLDADGDDLELATIVGLYALGELTLGEAADRADVSRIRMQEILDDAGVDLRLGPDSIEDARDEVDVARRTDE